MKRNISFRFVALLHRLYSAPGWQFLELLPQPFPQKQVNMRATESLCSGFDVTSSPRPCSVKLGCKPKWRHLDVLWRGIKIWGFNQIKNCLHQITPQNKLYYFSEKIFGVRCTFKAQYLPLCFAHLCCCFGKVFTRARCLVFLVLLWRQTKASEFPTSQKWRQRDCSMQCLVGNTGSLINY